MKKGRNKTKYFLGVDVGKYHHEVVLSDENGKPLAKSLNFANNYSGYQKLIAYLEKQVNKVKFHQIQAGMEATGPYWPALWSYLKKLGLKTVVLNPLQVKAYRNESIRGSKTDKIDAELIVKILRFGEYRPSDILREQDLKLRHLTRFRYSLIKIVVGLKKRVLSIYAQVFPEYKKLFTDVFSSTSCKLLEQAVLPEQIAAIPTKKLIKLVKKASRGKLGKNKALKIKQVARESIGTTIGLDAFSLSLKILLEQINHLEEQIKRLDKEIERQFNKQPNTLTTIPGIGKVLAASIKAEIGNFDRFANDKDGAEKLVALAGLDPKLKESGKHKGKARMSKRGSPYLRTAIRQASFMLSFNKDPMFAAIYQKQIKKGKHFEVALSHIGNKLLHVIFSLLKSGKKYEPHIKKEEV